MLALSRQRSVRLSRVVGPRIRVLPTPIRGLFLPCRLTGNETTEGRPDLLTSSEQPNPRECRRTASYGIPEFGEQRNQVPTRATGPDLSGSRNREERFHPHDGAAFQRTYAVLLG